MRDIDWPLIIEFEVVDELFIDILIVEDIFEESDDFVEFPCVSGWFALSRNNPSSGDNSAAFGLYLALLYKEDAFEESVFEEGFSRDSFW